MPYVGNPLANAFSSRVKQDLTGQSGTSFTLTHAVSSANDLSVYINHVRQEPTTAYTVDYNTLTTTGSVAGTDDFYIMYDELGLQSIAHDSAQAMKATSGTFTGAITTTGVTSSGGVAGTTGTFSGAVSGTTGTFSTGNPQVFLNATSDGGEGSINFKDDQGNIDGKIAYRTDYAGNTDNYMTFNTNGSNERMRIDSAGNIGIGQAPETGHHSNWTAVDIGNRGGIAQYKTAGDITLSYNLYHDGAWKAKETAPSGRYVIGAGPYHIWYTGASASADAAVTLTERMRISDAGNVGIGASPESAVKLEVNAGSDGAVAISGRSDGGNGNNRRFNIIPFSSNGTYGGGLRLQTRNTSNVFHTAVEYISNQQEIFHGNYRTCDDKNKFGNGRYWYTGSESGNFSNAGSGVANAQTMTNYLNYQGMQIVCVKVYYNSDSSLMHETFATVCNQYHNSGVATQHSHNGTGIIDSVSLSLTGGYNTRRLVVTLDPASGYTGNNYTYSVTYGYNLN